uniref:FeS cluster assembly protein sufB n=1 Tax=Anthurium amnicola TaxID=1678845 RepID=A0A1D1Y0M3_9ARAE
MMKGSNALIGAINFLTLLISIPILAGGIWLSNKANTECLRFLQWPLIVIGVTLMVLSLAGFAGACYRLSWLLWLYLFAMFFVVAAFLAFVIFAFAVTDKGEGQPVVNRGYLEYRLGDYSGWLRDRVADQTYWSKISSCLRDARVCHNMARYVPADGATGLVVPESADMFYQRKLSPIESGCCKPPTSCGFMYVNETVWNPGGGTVVDDLDCTRWSNDQQVLCYGCDSCKAGVLASLKRSWRKVSVINIVLLILLVIVYVVGCAAFRNTRRIDNEEPFGMARMTKAQPSRFQF